MSTLGKVLAILNVFAALAFVCLAALAWGQRQAWTYAVFRHDLLIRGLPVDDQDKDVDGVPIAAQLGSDTLAKIFQSGQPVKTQVEEVKRKMEELRGQFAADEEQVRAQKLRAILRPLAHTEDERDSSRAAKLDELEAKFQDAVRAAPEGKAAPGKALE